MIFLIVIVVIIFIGFVLAYLILQNFKVPKQRHEKSPLDFGIDFEEHRIPTLNDKKLYAWWIKAKKPAPTIILMHGWGKSCERLMPYIKNLHGKGYNILAFDARSHGNSDDDGFSSMIKFAEDISSCIDFAENKQTTEKSNFFLIGLSIGGAASIYAAANDKRIKRIVSIGAPANPADVLALHIRKRHIPQPIIWLTFEFMQYKIGKRFSEICADKNISKSSAKVLLVHGTKDRVVPFSQGERILKGANPNQAELWAINGKGHSNCHYEKGFWDRIMVFLSQS